MCWYLSAWMARQGHEVTLFARTGSEVPGVDTVDLDLPWTPSDVARRDSSMPDEAFLQVHHAYLDVLAQLGRHRDRFDVVQIHGLHPLPVALAAATGLPTVLTLHSPPTPWLESALAIAGDRAPRLVCVSRATARQWRARTPEIEVIPNGVDLDRWDLGTGASGAAAWAGRIVPEKAPHLAIAGARLAGMPLRLAGPIADPTYFRAEIEPHLGEHVDYLGRLDHAALSRLIGDSEVLLQTPQWDEPFCLSAAEAIACGTPVAAFDRGGLGEVVGRDGGVLTAPGDPRALAVGVLDARRICRRRVRTHAETTLSLARTGAAYLDLYGRVREEWARRPR